MRYPMPSTASGTALLIAPRTCSSFGRSASGCAAMYSSTDFGTLCFIPLILCFGMRFFLAVYRSGLQFLQRSLPHCQCLGGATWTWSLRVHVARRYRAANFSDAPRARSLDGTRKLPISALIAAIGPDCRSISQNAGSQAFADQAVGRGLRAESIEG